MNDPFTVLADPVRRRILELLVSGERAAGDLAEVLRPEFGISQPAVSQHLKVLRDRGFTRVRAEGTRRIYALEPASLEAADAWLEQVRGFWGERLEDLAEEVARGRAARGEAPATPRVLSSLDQVLLEVRDVAEAEAWYSGTLGLPRLGAEDGRVVFDIGGLRLVLVGRGAPSDREPATAASVGAVAPIGSGVEEPLLRFRVHDVQVAYQALRSRGVRFREAPRLARPGEEAPAEWVAVFEDPEGRPLAIVASGGP